MTSSKLKEYQINSFKIEGVGGYSGKCPVKTKIVEDFIKREEAREVAEEKARLAAKRAKLRFKGLL